MENSFNEQKANLSNQSAHPDMPHDHEEAQQEAVVSVQLIAPTQLA